MEPSGKNLPIFARWLEEDKSKLSKLKEKEIDKRLKLLHDFADGGKQEAMKKGVVIWVSVRYLFVVN